MAATRKQIAFDLDTKALEVYYPSDSWRNAYYDIKNHMEKNGFKWLQGSVYISEKSMTSYRVAKILKDLVTKNPWLTVCMRDCRETNIGKQHNKNHLFVETEKVLTRAEMREKAQDRGMSLSEYKKKIKVEQEKDNQVSGNKVAEKMKDQLKDR